MRAIACAPRTGLSAPEDRRDGCERAQRRVGAPRRLRDVRHDGAAGHPRSVRLRRALPRVPVRTRPTTCLPPPAPVTRRDGVEDLAPGVLDALAVVALLRSPATLGFEGIATRCTC